MFTFDAFCDNCGETYHTEEAHIGRTITCTKCRQPLLIRRPSVTELLAPLREATPVHQMREKGKRFKMTLLPSKEYVLNLLRGFFFLALTGGVIRFVVESYQAADSAGWISHHQDTRISAESSWFVGESKECASYPLDAKTAAAAGKGAGYAFDSLSCDNGPYRDVRVTFHGRANQPEYDLVTWKCTREQDGFTCNFVTGHRISDGKF